MAGAANKTFSDVFDTLVRQIARAMVRNEVTIAEATEVMKRALIEAAQEVSGNDATDSRLALLTGVHRKDVKRLRSESPRPPKRSSLSGAATVLAIWASHPEFSSGGKPRVLPRRGTEKNNGFDDLVRASRVDVPAATLLEHLVKEGAVEDQNGVLHMVRRTLGVGTDAQASLEAYERNIAAHIEAATENLIGDKQLERALHVNRLSAGSLQVLEKEASVAAQDLLVKFNERALELQEEDMTKAPDAVGRFTLGAFVNAREPRETDT